MLILSILKYIAMIFHKHVRNPRILVQHISSQGYISVHGKTCHNARGLFRVREAELVQSLTSAAYLSRREMTSARSCSM